jgi:hypothetical protein
MRVAFFVLLLVNGAFLAWAGWIDAAPRAAGARSNSNISTLMLASEMKAASNAAARGPASAAKLETAASPVSCFSVGPFNTLQRSASAATVLQQRGLAPRQREEQGEVWDGYWVYVGGLKNAAAEARVVYILDQAGLPEARVMPRSGGDRRVSVGLFKDRNRAERRAQVVRRLNLEAQIGERRVPATIYWLDLNLGPNEGAVSTAGLISPAEAEAELQVRACPALPLPPVSG